VNDQAKPMHSLHARAPTDDAPMPHRTRPPRVRREPPTLNVVLNALGVDAIADIPPSALLDRHQLAVLLTALGLKVMHASLETWASDGRGPPYRKWGSASVRYQWADAQCWAGSRLSAPLASAAAHRTRERSPSPATGIGRRRHDDDGAPPVPVQAAEEIHE
jgi:hypothetical protein